MPIFVTWKNEAKTILAYSYDGDWSLNDFYRSQDEGRALLDSIKHPAAMVIDVRGIRKMPSGFMAALNNVEQKLHPNIQMVIMLGLNPFARAFERLRRKVYPATASSKEMLFASHDDEVQAIVQNYLAQPHPIRD